MVYFARCRTCALAVLKAVGRRGASVERISAKTDLNKHDVMRLLVILHGGGVIYIEEGKRVRIENKFCREKSLWGSIGDALCSIKDLSE